MVELIGEPKSLEILSNFLPSPELGIVLSEEKSFLAGTALEAATSAANAHAFAGRLLRMANGLAVLSDANFRPISVGSQVFREDTAGKPKWVSSVISATAYFPRGSYSWDSAQVPNPTAEWMRMAFSNPKFQKALGCLADGQGADDLYRVFEIARAAIGGESAIVRRQLATRKEIKLFERTMNVSGVGFGPARHAEQKMQPPAKPMLLPDAKRFIQVLLSCWVESKSGRQQASPEKRKNPGVRRE